MQIVRSEKTVKLSALRGASVFGWNGNYYLKLNHPVCIQGDVRSFTAVSLGLDATLLAIDYDTQVTVVKGKFVEDIPK